MSSGSSIIASISSNLSNTYSYLASLYPEDGVTYKNITAARNDNTNYLTLNQPFEIGRASCRDRVCLYV